jgi:hypothetical protein
MSTDRPNCYSRVRNSMMESETEIARRALPLPLRTYMETDRDGHLTFCYPYEVGTYTSQTNHIKQKLDEALRRRGADKTAALKEVQKFVDNVVKEHDLLHAQWNAEIERRRAVNDRKFTDDLPAKGGPIVGEPDRPYCKPDQSCCDFCCGN